MCYYVIVQDLIMTGGGAIFFQNVLEQQYEGSIFYLHVDDRKQHNKNILGYPIDYHKVTMIF